MATSELTVVCLSAIGAACGCYLKLSSPEECTCVYSYILAKSRIQTDRFVSLDGNLEFTSWSLFGLSTASTFLNRYTQNLPSKISVSSEEPALIYMGEDNNDQFLPHNPESAPTATNRDRYEQLAVYKHSSVPIRVCKAHERASRSVIALASATTTDLS